MKRILSLILLLLCCSCAFGQTSPGTANPGYAFCQTSSGSITSSGNSTNDQSCSLGISNAAGGDDYGNIAVGSLAALNPPSVSDESGTQFNAVSAELQPNGSTTPIPLTLSTPPCSGNPVANSNCYGQTLLAYIPRDTPVGQATVTVHYSNDTEAVGTVNVVETSFGLYTNSRDVGPNPASAQNLTSNGAETNNLTHPAHPGGSVTLWGTGLGLATADQVAVTLAGVTLNPQSAGSSSDTPGLDRIDFPLPNAATMPEGCYVPVTVEIGNKVSNTGTVSLSRSSTSCPHPFSLSTELMSKLDSGDSIALALIDLYSTIGPPQNFNIPFSSTLGGFVRTESASADFSRFYAVAIAQLSMNFYLSTSVPRYFGFQTGFGLPIPYDYLSGCQGIPVVIYERTDSAASPALIGSVPSAFASPSSLTVGQQIDINGPGGKTLPLLGVTYAIGDFSQFLGYGIQSSQSFTADIPDHLPPPFFSAGVWNASAAGGQDGGPFSVTLNLPSPIQVTKFEQLYTADINKDITLSWDAKGYLPDDSLKLRWDVSFTDAQGNYGTGGAVCRVSAADGKLTIPAMIPASTSPSRQNSSVAVVVERRPGAFKSFSIQLKDGTSAPGVIRYHSAEQAEFFGN